MRTVVVACCGHLGSGLLTQSPGPRTAPGDTMALARPWAKRSQGTGVLVDEPEKKRRRIPLHQVVQELNHAGLTQPALSFVQEVEKRRRLCAPEPSRIKRDGTDLSCLDVMKRRRIDLEPSVPVLKIPESDCQGQSQLMPQTQLLPLGSRPGSLGPNTVQLLLSGATGLRHVTMDSHGIMFEVFDHGFMFIDKNSIPSYARGDMEDYFSPSTVDPSPSMEGATDEEDAMEWEEMPELG
eukprot:Skav230523  [mRNA]  locus=scaffold1183:16466:19975:+ [translate_table: standard]